VIDGTSLLYVVVWVIVLGIIFWLLRYLIDVVPMEPPFKKVANVLLTVAMVLILIALLLSLTGVHVIRW
jgi:uncharacterized membrane protein YwzB